MDEGADTDVGLLLQEEERLVFSHRRASSDTDMQNFKVGDVVTGVVQSVKVYGAFLDIGGAMGLLHISQITHERLTTVEQVLQVSCEVQTEVGCCLDADCCLTA